MKVVITENKRDKLAKQELDKEFSNMYEDVNYITDGVGEHKRIEYRNGDGVIMLYGDRSESLYICDDVIKPIIYFSYTPHQVKMLVKEWFSEKFGLPVGIIHHTVKGLLN
jgi:hypothetical protein